MNEWIEYVLQFILIVVGLYIAYCHGRLSQQRHCARRGQDEACRRNVNMPDRTDSQFEGSAPITIHVQTMDAKSFNDNSHLVAGAVQHALQTGKAPNLQETIRNIITED